MRGSSSCWLERAKPSSYQQAIHRLGNDGENELRAIVGFRPALSTGEAFEQLFCLARDGNVGRRGLPNPFRLAVLAQTY